MGLFGLKKFRRLDSDKFIVIIILLFLLFLDVFSGILYNTKILIHKQFIFNIITGILIFSSVEDLRMDILNKVSSFILVVFMIMYLTDIGLNLNEEGRMVIGGDNHNYFAVKVAMLAGLATNGKHIRLFFFLPAVLLNLSVGSRSGFILLLCVLTIRFYEHRKSIGLIFLLLLGCFAMRHTLYNIWVNSVVYKRLLLSLNGTSYGGRDKVFDLFFSLLYDSNLALGMGYSGLSSWTKHYFSVEYWTPHNVFLEVLIRNGILGLMALLFLLWRAVKKVNDSTSLIWILTIVIMLMSAQFYGSKFTFGLTIFYFMIQGKIRHGESTFSNR